MTYTLGALPRSSRSKMLSKTASWCALSTYQGTVMQKVAFVRNQQAKPSCVGQAVASCVDSKNLGAEFPLASATQLWIDARRRQGNLEGCLDGTRVEYALDSLKERGVGTYTSEDDTQDIIDDGRIPSLMKELEADTHRVNVSHYILEENRSERVRQALQAGQCVVLCTGVSYDYGDMGFNQVVTPRDLDPNMYTRGHAQRVFAYFDDVGLFGVVNSWGVTWGGFAMNSTEAHGVFKGCVLVEPACIEQAWDIDVFDVTLAP